MPERIPALPPVQLTVHSIGNSFKVWRNYRGFDALQQK
jgi:hypothetical protein